MKKSLKKICSVLLSIIFPCASVSALAQGIWGSEEQIAQQETQAEIYSCANYISWIETVGEEIVISGRMAEKEGMPVTCLVTGDGIVEIMQGTVRAKGYYSFFVSDVNFSGETQYEVRIAAGNTTLNLDYYHRTNREDLQILNTINEGGAGSVLKDSRLNLNLYNYSLLENQQAVADALSSSTYTSVREFIDAFYREVYRLTKNNTNIVYYVSESGSDANPGTSDAPFATVTKAYDTVSDLVSSGKTVSDIDIIIGDGNYTIDKTLYFNEYNTGKNQTIRIIACNSGKAVITGAEKIAGFTRYSDNVYVKNVGAGRDIKMLYNNDEMMWIARYPNRGIQNYDLPGDYALTTASNPLDSKKRISAYIDPEILKGTENNRELEIGIWPNGSDNGHWMWYFNIVDVTDADYETGMVIFAQPTTHNIGSGAKFYIQNDLKFLDAENEFYYDSQSGNLYVWAEDESVLDITLPLVDDIVTFEHAANVKLQGVKLQNSRRTKDYTYTYQTNDSGNGIKIADSSNITIQNCIVSNVGGHGIYLVNSGENNLVTGNEVFNTFGTGISINGEENSSEMNFINNVISNNYVHATGLVVGNSTGIALYHSGAEGNTIKNNLIHDCPRSAIRVSDVNSINYITYNDVYDVNKGSQDTGVIYVEGLGKNAETHIENNYIHDSYSWIELTIGLYLDDSAFGTVARNNVIANLGKTEYPDGNVFGYCMYLKADDITAENNYIIDNPEASTITGSYAQNSTADRLTIVRNVFANSGNTVYTHENYDKNRLTASDYNLIDTNGSPVYRVRGLELTFDEWRNSYKKDVNSVSADAQISDSKNLDFRLLETSPAFSMGIKNIDMANMGLTEDFVYNTGGGAPHRVFVKEEFQKEDSTTFDMSVGQTKKLLAFARNEAGFIVQNLTYTFESENTEVAEVDDRGRVIAKKPGAAKIIVTASNGAAAKQSYIIAKVAEPTLRITRIECFDENQNPITSPWQHIENVVVSYEGEGTGTDMLMAFYDERGKMLYLQMDKISDKGRITVNTAYEGENPVRIKVFAWNLDTMYPFDCKEIY
ncbi:MAG: right-handed parallel beta-helix repeat-containing protein [Clostridia bacterium]|nr:right-handed parallel beta-helix repeat-containing protein [Clostridia bacterium]